MRNILFILFFTSSSLAQSVVGGTFSAGVVTLTGTEMHTYFADAAVLTCNISSGTDWEVASCTYNYPANTLTIGTLSQNSNGNTIAITFQTYHNTPGNITPVSVMYFPTPTPIIFHTAIANLAVTNSMLTGSIAYSKLSLTGAILNADLAGSIAYSKLSLTGAILNADLAGSIAYSKLSLTGAILNADLAGSIDLTTKVTGILPFANGGCSAAAAAPATTGAMTVNMTTEIITITPTGACTFNGSGGTVGQTSTFIITTAGTSAFVLTWGTNFKTSATLSTGTLSGKTFCVTFRCLSPTQWYELSRTAAM